MKTILLILILGVSWMSWHHITPGDIDEVVTLVNQYHENYPQEKFYLHIDKPYYVLGETIWFQIYGTLATSHIPLIPSGLVYVSLLDNHQNILTTRYIQIKQGTGKGDILIDPNWKISGAVTLRVHSNYNLNFDHSYIFQKSINIYDTYQTVIANQSMMEPDQSSEPLPGLIKMNFYPEGGDLVTGLSSIVAVKTTNERAKGISVKAKVFDSSNNLVTLFITNELGYGSFKLTPSANQRYHVEAINGERSATFKLPVAIPEGSSLSIKAYRPDSLAVITQSNIPNALVGAHLIGHIRGEVFSKISLDEVGSNAFIIPTIDLPGGIAHFTLFDRQNMPVAERLVFIRPKPIGEKIEIKLNQTTYSRQQNGVINLTYEGNRTDSLLAFASISIHDQLLSNRPKYDIDILSYLLLTSDLPGVIEKPGYYFDESEVSNEKDLDLVMLTHGWRRFSWKDILARKALNLQYLPENGFTISGQSTRIANDKGTKANVFLSTLDANFSMLKTVTDAEGYFTISDLQFSDTTTIVLQADRFSDKDRNSTSPSKDYLNINLDSDYPFLGEGISLIPAIIVDPENLNRFLNESRYTNQVNQSYDNLWSIDLDEITVTSEKVEPSVQFHKSRMLYKEPDNRLFIDSIPAAHSKITVFDAIRGRIPGMEVVGEYPTKTVRIRGSSSIKLNTTATILLDGVPVSIETANSISPDRIAFVDVLKGVSSSALYGSSGNGVLAIYSKNPDEEKGKFNLKTGILRLNHPGYYQAREFYTPDYSHPVEDEVDYRTTLLWAPELTFTQLDTMLEIPFSTSERTSIYQLVLQGIGTNGRPISKTINFSVDH